MRVNKRKGEDVKGSRVKKSKKGEVHYCPDPPEGPSAEDIEGKRRMIKVHHTHTYTSYLSNITACIPAYNILTTYTLVCVCEAYYFV